MTTTYLEVAGLKVATPQAELVSGVSLSIGRRECLALVGESGSGKTMTARAIAGLLPGAITASGSVMLDDRDLLSIGPKERREISGPGIGFVFQDAMSALHPLMSIREQMVRPLRQHLKLGKKAARARALELLEQVGIVDARSVLDGYIHQLSGGMRQRVMIAMAVSCGPGLLIADEPTTALDANVQEKILRLITDLKNDGDIAVLLISHDLPLVSRYSDRIAVMYGGKVLETGVTSQVLTGPQHPYTQGLLAASPERNRGARRLPVFSGAAIGLDGEQEGVR